MRLCLENFISAQDPGFAAFSTGSIILMECLKWCRDRNLAYDFRFGVESYKMEWATEDRPATTYQFAIRPWGQALLRLNGFWEGARVFKDRVRVAIPADFRRGVKQFLIKLRTARGVISAALDPRQG